MASEKNNPLGNTDMLLLKLLSIKDMYGYQIIEELANRSDNIFELKAGTLYPLLHLLENKMYVESYDMAAPSGKKRKYYRITDTGLKFLTEKEKEWELYTSAVNGVLKGAVSNG